MADRRGRRPRQQHQTKPGAAKRDLGLESQHGPAKPNDYINI